MVIRLIFISVLLFFSSSADAQKSQILKEDIKKLEKELKDIRKQSVSTAKKVQRNQQKLGVLKQKILVLENDEKKLQEELIGNQIDISKLISALQKFRRVSPEVMIFRPENPEEIARSALLLSHIVPNLNLQAEKLQSDLQELSLLKKNLKDKKLEAELVDKELQSKEKELLSVLQKRQKLYKHTQKDYDLQEIESKKLAQKSKNLHDFVQNIHFKPDTPSKVKTYKPDLPAAGAARLPAQGFIQVHFDAPDAFGGKSQGIEIRSNSRALVVSPMGGIVRFAGQFKNYGNIVIIEHKNGYHSLVAGLEKIDTLVGQSLSAGEPLGKLGRKKDGLNPKLYYELRYKGKPINPAKKISGIS